GEGGTTATGIAGTTGAGGTKTTGAGGTTGVAGHLGTGGATATGAGGTTVTGAGGAKTTGAGGTTVTGAGGSAAGAGGSAAGHSGAAGTTGSAGTTGTGGGSSTAVSGLPLPPGAGGTPKPSGTPGNITVLNWAGFKGAVSYSLDDDNDSQIADYSTLEAQGIPYTFYMWGNRTEASNSVWTQAVKDGHEIGNHTWSHSSTPPGGVADINQDTTFIMQKYSVTPYTMAAPNGASVYTGLANGLFMTNRGVADAIVMPNDNTDRFTLPCYIPPMGAPASDFNSEVDSAQSAGGWRIILVHGFIGSSNDDSEYQPVNLTDYTAGITHAKGLGNMWIGKVVDVAAYWLGQKAFSSATTMTSGTSKTWTWTKPSNFAPGKYLRVTVAGGTLTQGGQTLPWNDHGFYEISLDAGSVTLGP
ncbi:MAG TPA: polysaccharide deacetylase family protein, partial [Polyangia bacterium]|nr:polysaccharide deacetylase family protein [Polyangia bacterium]